MPRTGLFAALGNAFQVVFQNLFTVLVLSLVAGGLGTAFSDFMASLAVKLVAPERGRPELLVSELTRTAADLGWGATVGALTAACTLYLWVQRERGQATSFYDALNFGLNRWGRMWKAHGRALLAVQLGMLVIVPGILFGLQYAFVDAIATLDAKEPNPGERSRKLTARRRGLIFSTFAIFGLWWIPYQGLLMFMIQDPSAFLGGQLGLAPDTVSWLGPLLMPAAGVVNGLVLVLIDLCMVQYYLDLFRKPANAGAEGASPSATPPPTPVEGTVGGDSVDAPASIDLAKQD